MTEDNIEKIRKDAIADIKEKTKRNPRYLHPMNKERQEDMKRLKFANGNDFTCWMQQKRITKSPTDVNRKDREKIIKSAGCKTETEYKDRCAKNAGFKDYAKREKVWRHETGINLPKEDNTDCSVHFGEFTENLMIQTFENPMRMLYGNPGFDWKCKNGDKIDNKCRCLKYSKESKWSGWQFSINYNNIADWFILSAWDDRDSLTPLHVWIFHKNDIVRGRKFWRRESFSITNTLEGLEEFEKYEVTGKLEKLKELCNRFKDHIRDIYNSEK